MAEKLRGTGMLENIFNRLPIEVALHAKCACTTWKDVLRNRKSDKIGFVFVFSHYEGQKCIQQLFYGDEYDHARAMNYFCSHDHNTLTKIKHARFNIESPRNIIVGSCNGLVCFGRYAKYAVCAVPFLICNPVTGESLVLPEYDCSKLPLVPTTRRFNYCLLASGFGYCPSTNKYKVVTIYYCEVEQKAHVQVYTVGGGDQWRYIGFISRSSNYKFNYSSGIYANGEMYWLHHSNPKVLECGIEAFDVETEKFRYIQLPRSEDFAINMADTSLTLLGGNDNLYLVHSKASGIDLQEK